MLRLNLMLPREFAPLGHQCLMVSRLEKLLMETECTLGDIHQTQTCWKSSNKKAEEPAQHSGHTHTHTNSFGLWWNYAQIPTHDLISGWWSTIFFESPQGVWVPVFTNQFLLLGWLVFDQFLIPCSVLDCRMFFLLAKWLDTSGFQGFPGYQNISDINKLNWPYLNSCY